MKPHLAPDIMVLNRTIPEEHIGKCSSYYIRLSKLGEKTYLNKQKTVIVSFNKDKLLIMFDPLKGVKAYQLRLSGDYYILYSPKLNDKIYDFFNLDKKITRYYFQITPHSKKNNKIIYELKPLDTVQHKAI